MGVVDLAITGNDLGRADDQLLGGYRDSPVGGTWWMVCQPFDDSA